MFDVVSCCLLQFEKDGSFLITSFICSLPSSSVHLPPVMPPDAPYRLPQSIRPTVLVVRMGSLVLVEDDHRSLLRILRIMQIPVVAGIPGHDRHIVGIRGYNGEILRIQAFQIFITEHGQPPSRQTTLPAPAPQGKPSALRSCPQNTCCRLPWAISGSRRWPAFSP